MPTFFDSTADAGEASEALRGLAHASRTFDQPAQMYGVIGDLSSGMRSLRQVLEQLADVHERKVAHAFNDDGGHAAGVRDALATAEELRRSARLVDQAYDRLAEAFVTIALANVQLSQLADPALFDFLALGRHGAAPPPDAHAWLAGRAGAADETDAG